MDKNLSFSQRYGYVKIDDEIQIKKINVRLRTKIWNFVYYKLTELIVTERYEDFANSFYIEFLCAPADEVRNHLFRDIKRLIMNNTWYEVYDFLEFFIGENFFIDNLMEDLNKILEEENSGYRIIDDKISPIVQKEELTTIENAINNSKDDGIKIHLKKALEYLSDREKPDYRNSIKESISAVGVYCRKKTGEATLDKAIIKLQSKKIIFPKMLEEAMKKLYYFTNGKDGIRHELMNESVIDKEEAYFMLVACSNFINYLRIKETKIEK